MGHSNTMWLHGMALTIVVVTDVTFVRNTNKTLEHEDKIQLFPLKTEGQNFVQLILSAFSRGILGVRNRFVSYHRNNSKLSSFRQKLCTPCR